MNAPFSRDEQIELMRTAKEVHDRRMSNWLRDSSIREVVSNPAAGQEKDRQYISTDLMVACC